MMPLLMRRKVNQLRAMPRRFTRVRINDPLGVAFIGYPVTPLYFTQYGYSKLIG